MQHHKYVDAISLKDQMQNNGKLKIVDQSGNWLELDRTVRATKSFFPSGETKIVLTQVSANTQRHSSVRVTNGPKGSEAAQIG